MPFIERGPGNKIVGIYAIKQPGVADSEQLPETNPEVIAFRNPVPDELPITTEEIWDVLVKNNLVDPVIDRPRPKPQATQP